MQVEHDLIRRMPWDFWLIFLVLGVLLPWRGRVRLKKMLATPKMRPRERILLYASTIAFQWFVVAVTAWRASARGLSKAALGLAILEPLRLVFAAVVGGLTLGTLQWLNLRRMGKSASRAREFMQALAERILPKSRVEVLAYLALAVTAGVCEEFLYRGFAMAALFQAGFSPLVSVFISSVLFGLAHLYQGRGGAIGTSLIGLLFGGARLAYDGLLPVMAWHFAVDAAAGIAGPRYLVRPAAAASEEMPAVVEL